jgi:prophage antirepressor-like protein
MQNESSVNPVADQATAPIALPVIVVFMFLNQPVRVTTIDGTEFFIAIDLAPILGFKNARQAVRTHVSRHDRHGVQIVDAIGRVQTLLAVNESGLYAMAFGSTKPEAQDFKHWVTAVLLPTLRKTGRYELSPRVPALMDQISKALLGRGAAKSRQITRIKAHRKSRLFSVQFGGKGGYWVHNLSTLNVAGLPLSHALREGLALKDVREGPGSVKLLVQ